MILIVFLFINLQKWCCCPLAANEPALHSLQTDQTGFLWTPRSQWCDPWRKTEALLLAGPSYNKLAAISEKANFYLIAFGNLVMLMYFYFNILIRQYVHICVSHCVILD